MTSLSFDQDGAALYDRAAVGLLRELGTALGGCAVNQPGVRLHHLPALEDLLAVSSAIGRIAADRLGPNTRAVRAILFDKTPGINWSLGRHQDRTIAVREQHKVPGFGPWSSRRASGMSSRPSP